MTKIKLLIVDDHEIVRDGLKANLKNIRNIKVVGEASNGEEAIQRVEEVNPDVILMDISMPLMNGLVATERIKKKYPNIKIITLSVHSEDSYILEMLRLGASGYILKSVKPAELISSIEKAYRGDAVFTENISQNLLNKYLNMKQGINIEDSNLTEREIEVLKLVALGFSSKEIADKIFLSINTVNAHRKNIMKKLNLHSESKLTKYAIEKKMLDV